MTNPYLDFVQRFAGLSPDTLRAPESVPASASQELDATRPCAIVLSPHPDDECLTGGLPLRLCRENGWRIINMAVTLGSNPNLKATRWNELSRACAVLGIETIKLTDMGFANVRPPLRKAKPTEWFAMVERLADVIAGFRPRALFLPHKKDGHIAHTGTHVLGLDALAHLGHDFRCAVAQTEYWHPHEKPNCLVEVSAEQTAKLLEALCCHTSQNARNAYHLRFPAYLMDNVRRGSERVLGEGSADLRADFALLYRVDSWRNGKLESHGKNRVIGLKDNALSAFPPGD